MSLNRRQFLILGNGAIAGLGLAAIASACSTSAQTAQTAQTAPSPVASPAAAATASPSQSLRIAVISDLNSRYGSTDYEPEVDKAIALMSTWKPNLVLCGGDMVAAQEPSLSEAQLRAMWAAFDQHVAAPLRQLQIPYGFTLGNHDASGARTRDGQFLFRKDRAIAAAYWNDPRHATGLQFGDRTGFPFYYTFQQNDVFFLVWDASTAQIPSNQLAWADRTLASPAAQAAKLRIVIGHLPIYAVAVGRDEAGEYLNDGDRLRALLERHRVHTYISGHHHAYYPGHVGNLQTLHCGILGSGMRPLLEGSLRPTKTVTLIDADMNTADTAYTTYNMQTMALIDQQTLPRLIASPTGKILRRDVEMADLTPAERAMEYVPSF